MLITNICKLSLTFGKICNNDFNQKTTYFVFKRREITTYKIQYTSMYLVLIHQQAQVLVS